jgi:hypothetical protein
LNGNSKIIVPVGGLALLGAALYWFYFRSAQSLDAGGNTSGDGDSWDPSLGGSPLADPSADPSSDAGLSWASITDQLSTIGQTLGTLVGITPKGIRNNNPGNLRYVAAIAWQGQLGDDGSGYAVFDTPEHGVRAMAHQLLTYASRGTNTVSAIISTWAPPNENATAAYIADVAQQIGANANAPLNVSSVLPELVAAMINHENGEQPYDPSDIERWVYE